MDDEIYVTCHAPSMSLLLFETVRSVHDQKGLLIGQICKEVFSKKTDDNEGNQEQKTAIYIEHCVPIEDNEVFQNSGDVKTAAFQKYIEQFRNKIIGWYTFRRNTRIVQCTMRETLIHKSLLDAVPSAKPELFVAAFMSASVNGNCSTHTYNHIFMRSHPVSKNFEPLKLKIFTLSDKIVNSSGYSTKSSLPTARQFDKILNAVQKDDSPVNSVLAVHKQVGSLLNRFDKLLQDTEKERLDLENEVILLKKKLGYDTEHDIVVEEDEDEYAKEEALTTNYVKFDPTVKYNPNRKTNPIVVDDQPPTPPSPPIVPEKQDKEDLKPEVKIESVRSYSSVTRTSPSFNTKTPKFRPGLGDLSNSRNNSAVKKRETSPDLFESPEDPDTRQEKSSEVRKADSPNSMEY